MYQFRKVGTCHSILGRNADCMCKCRWALELLLGQCVYIVHACTQIDILYI